MAVTGGADQLNAVQSTAPKKIHTVPIRPDQAAPSDATATAAPPPASVVAPRPPTQRVAKPAAQADANAPLSIVPNQGGETPHRTGAQPGRSGHARPRWLQPQAPLRPRPGARAATRFRSRPSAAKPKRRSAFRALQAKFPDQLGGRQPLVRRADLGDKGIFYRALVGPFASMEQAAAMCSSLKAAGGTCIVQRD